jgi:hypothetical protein
MRDRDTWLVALTEAAPGCDRTMLRVVAAVLSCPGRQDVLLCVGDALAEATTELMLDGRARLAAEIMAIGALVDGEIVARLRVGGFW